MNWPAELQVEDLEWRHHFWNNVSGAPTRPFVAQVTGREAIECDSATAIMSYVMGEPYWDTGDLEVVKLNMRLMLASLVETEIGRSVCVRTGAVVLRGDEKDPPLNVLNERTMIADLIGLGWLAVSERADSFMLRGGDVLKERRWGGCLFCAHREEDHFCGVYRLKREDQSPVGVCCIDFFPSDAVKKASSKYVVLEAKDVFIPRYTAMIPDGDYPLVTR